MQPCLSQLDETVVRVEALQSREELVDHLRHLSLAPVQQLLDSYCESAVYEGGRLRSAILTPLATAALPVLRTERLGRIPLGEEVDKVEALPEEALHAQYLVEDTGVEC